MTKKTNIQTNLLGVGCYLRELRTNPQGDRCLGEADCKHEYKIVAVWLAEGEDKPSVAVAETRLGGGVAGLVIAYLDQVVLFSEDVTFKIGRKK